MWPQQYAFQEGEHRLVWTPTPPESPENWKLYAFMVIIRGEPYRVIEHREEERGGVAWAELTKGRKTDREGHIELWVWDD